VRRWSMVVAALAVAMSVVPAAAVARSLQREGRWLIDEQGRVVVMHGVNFVQKTAPFYADNIGEQDARFLADEGFNAARVGIIWEGFEPAPGRYDDAYLRKVAAFDGLLARYGIRSLIDAHQDAWGAHTATGPIGLGDGAPRWATPFPGMLDDFQAFWDDAKAPDGVGLQTHFANAWRHVASVLGGSDNILGYDPFNEPYAGTRSACVPFAPCTAFEAGPLGAFYRRVIAAIRAAGDRHVIFPEAIAQNGIQPPALPAFADPQTAFSFHFYCPAGQFSAATESPPEAAACEQFERRGFGSFLGYADGLGVPAFLGEFSGNGPDGDNVRTVDAMGAHFSSWTLWAYQDVLTDATRPGSQGNAKQAKLDALVVPYPQATAGTPRTWAFDRATRTMTFAYTADAVPGARLARGARTRIFVPERHYPTGYRVQATGARVVSRPTAPWVMLAADRPGAAVTVKITPRTGSFTRTPLQARAFPRGPRGS